MQKISSAAYLFTACMALAACQKLWTSAPPAASPAQIARERDFLLTRFFQDACFTRMRETAQPVQIDMAADASYAVDFPADALVHDGYHYALAVRKSDRAGFLARSGGYFGSYETLGPLPLAQCLQEVF